MLTEALGRADADGYIYNIGRKDDVILCSGYRIGPEEVEASLADHDAVAAVGVVGVPDETRGEIPKAFVTLADSVDPSPALADDLKAHVKDRLAKYKYPRVIAFRDELPRTRTGKVKRADLAEE